MREKGVLTDAHYLIEYRYRYVNHRNLLINI